MSRTNAARAAEPEPSTIEALVSHKLFLLTNLMARSATLRYRRHFSLSRIEWAIVGLLGGQSPCGLKELADRAGRDKSQISRGISTLVERKLVARASDPRDSREVLLSLTPEGEAMFERMMVEATTRLDDLLGNLSPAVRTAFDDTLDRLIVEARRLLKADQREE